MQQFELVGPRDPRVVQKHELGELDPAVWATGLASNGLPCYQNHTTKDTTWFRPCPPFHQDWLGRIRRPIRIPRRLRLAMHGHASPLPAPRHDGRDASPPHGHHANHCE